jgi:CheY-like chemotaxis protein
MNYPVCPDVSTILIVDDDPCVRTLVKDCLRQNFQYQIAEASSSIEAIQKIFYNEISLIVCDLYMAESSGLEVFCYLKIREDLNPPLIFFTSSPESIPIGIRSEVPVIEKPNLMGLMRAIRAAIDDR